MQRFLSLLTEKIPPHRLKQQEPLSSHTSFKSGGLAEYYCEASSLTELMMLITLARENDIPVTLLGGGSSTLISDNGIEGLVIKNNCRKFEMISMQGKIRNRQLDVDRAFVYAESGALTNHVVRSTIEAGFSGLEYALGLPGTVGGAIATNAEYMPQHFVISDALYKARLFTPEGEIKEVDKSYFHFESGYGNTSLIGDIMLSVMFVLTPGHKGTLWEGGQEAAAYRTDIHESATSYGMTYRVLSLDKTQTLMQHNSLASIDELLIHAGIPGLRRGDVMISKSNPRFLCNMGHGTTRDAVALLHQCKKIMQEKYSTSLSIQMGEIGV